METHASKCNVVVYKDLGPEYPSDCNCDGYHTFSELYDHRVSLYITLCKMLVRDSEAAYNRNDPQPIYYRNGNVWRSQYHHDGSSFDGWFILGIRTDPGHQITYHLPMSRWNETNFAYTLNFAPEWDGHTSDDVLKRLKTL